MAIDGRQLRKREDELKPDPYDSTGARVVGVLLVVVPLAFIVVLTYLAGGGGVVGGVASIVSTAVFLGFMYMRSRTKSGR
jgi:hypothetical protein